MTANSLIATKQISTKFISPCVISIVLTCTRKLYYNICSLSCGNTVFIKQLFALRFYHQLYYTTPISSGRNIGLLHRRNAIYQRNFTTASPNFWNKQMNLYVSPKKYFCCQQITTISNTTVRYPCSFSFCYLS